MKVLKIKYKQEGKPIERVMKVLIDDVLAEELQDIVYSQIMNDLGVTMYEWCIYNSEEVENDRNRNV